MTEQSAQPTKFGTFGGVFTPNVLTILGVIMFLRFGEITGQAGVRDALLILLAAKAITSLTAISLAAIATNTWVKSGGAYYLISRSLGMEFGGGIAFVLYFAQAISVALYVIGFAEAFVSIFPDAPLDQRTVATIANIAVGASVLIGAGWTIRLQYLILAVLLLSLVSFGLGAGDLWSVDRLASNMRASYEPNQDALTMFALFFPAATGIMAGANMSGDLLNPSKSLPVGTFAAIAVTGAVYFALIVLLGGSIDRAELVTGGFVMHDVAAWPALIVAGVFSATLSSALGSMMGAPRILQAFARDGVFKRLTFLGKGSGASSEPRRAIIVTILVSQAAILLGDLDVIAPVITMFFLVTYGTLNLACFYEGYSRNPSFRPRFRFSHWSLGLLGALGCLATMLLMDLTWAIVALAAMVALYYGIRGIGLRARWGDVRSGVAFERARRALLRLEQEPAHAKNWRPLLLALVVGPRGRHEIAEYGYWLTAGYGVLTLGQVISGDVEDRLERGQQAARLLRRYIEEQGLGAFPAVVIEDDLLEGAKALLQCYGIGALKPNTVLLGWSDDLDEVERYAQILRLCVHLEKNIVVIKRSADRPEWTIPDGEIHVWWPGRKNGPLMLILTHLFLQNPGFRRRTVRVIHAVPEEAARDEAHRHLTGLVASARIDVAPLIVVTENLREALLTISRNAGVVVLGFDVPAEGEHIPFFQDIEVLTEGLGDVMLVASARPLDISV